MIHIPKAYQTLVECSVLFVVSTCLFTWGVSGQEVTSFDSRFYLFALEMWRHGITWFPTTYLKPYPDYPGLSTWLIVLFGKACHGLDKFSAVLPTAITAAMTVVVTYLIGSLQCKRWGLYAAGLLFFTLGFLKSSRSLSLDMYITLLTALSFYLLYSADVLREPIRMYGVLACLVLGFLFRGPIGFVIPAGVVFTYFLVQKSYKALLYFSVVAGCLLLLCIVALLCLAYQEGGEPFVNDVWRMQVFGRMGSSGIPLYYYLVESFHAYAIAYPIAMAVLVGLMMKDYRRPPHTTQQQFLFQVAGWVGVILIGMSIPGDKKIRYVLPMVPALALLAAYPIANRQTHPYFFWLRRVMLTFLFCLPGIIAAAIFYIQQAGLFHDYLAGLPLVALGNSLLVLQLIAIGSLFSHDLQRRVAIIFASALSAFLLIYFYVAEPIQFKLESARETVQAVEEWRLKSNSRLLFYQMGEDGLPIKYLINAADQEAPIFLNTPDELLAYQAPAVVLTRAENFDELTRQRAPAFDVLLKGKLGHAEVVVFKVKRKHGK